jgi:hypothetical protein
MDEDEILNIERERDRLKKKYEKEFDDDLGWAHGYVAGRPTFAQIEKAAKLDLWRPHYIWASSAVHGGIKGMLSDIGFLAFSDSEMQQMPSGPSNYGLADPAICSAIALHSCTRTLIKQRPSFESVAMIEALGMIVLSTEESFIKIQRKLDEEIEQGRTESDQPDLDRILTYHL